MSMVGLVNLLGGTNLTSMYALFLAFIIISYLLYNKIEDKNKKNTFLVYILAGFIILFFTTTQYDRASLQPVDQQFTEEGLTIWQQEYVDEAKMGLATYEDNILNMEYYDYFNATINDVAEQIILSSTTPEEAVTKAMEYVFQHTKYVSGESDDACYDGTAPQILESGIAQCDTQSIVVIALLRRMGIAATPVGGCVIRNNNCKLQSITALQSFSDVLRMPRFDELLEVDEESETFSRGIDQSRKGGLHAWVAVWFPETGWKSIEATAGMYIDDTCYDYHVEEFPSNQEKEKICVSMNPNYALACQHESMTLLDTNGLGLFGNEVTPE